VLVGAPSGKGAPVPEVDVAGRVTGYKSDEKGAPVLSKADATTLRKLAAATGGTFSIVAPGRTDLDGVAKAIDAAARRPLSGVLLSNLEERFQIPLAVSVGAAALLLLGAGAWSRPRRAKSAAVPPLTLALALALLAKGDTNLKRIKDCLTRVTTAKPKDADALVALAKSLPIGLAIGGELHFEVNELGKLQWAFTARHEGSIALTEEREAAARRIAAACGRARRVRGWLTVADRVSVVDGASALTRRHASAREAPSGVWPNAFRSVVRSSLTPREQRGRGDGATHGYHRARESVQAACPSSETCGREFPASEDKRRRSPRRSRKRDRGTRPPGRQLNDSEIAVSVSFASPNTSTVFGA